MYPDPNIPVPPLMSVWHSVCNWAWRPLERLPSVCSELTQPVAAFASNTSRLHKLAIALDNSYFAGKKTGSVEVCAKIEVSGRSFQLMSDGFEKIGQADELARRWVQGVVPMPTWVKQSEAAAMHGGEFIIASKEADAFTLAVDALISSLITGAWTAFEVLAGDLWEAALNAHPKDLARLAGKTSRLGMSKNADEPGIEFDEPEADDERAGRKDGKKVFLADIDIVTQGAFDLSKMMGTLLRRRFRFTTLSGIRRAYCAAFCEKLKPSIADIDAAIGDAALDRLSLLRNLIVHKAGRADDEYSRGAKGIPNAPPLAPGDCFTPTHNTLADVLEPALRTSTKLISAVDKWITA